MMKKNKGLIQNVEPFTQYNAMLTERAKRSACGPTTIATILHYWTAFKDNISTDHAERIREIYLTSHATWIGLFTWQLIRTLRRFGESKQIPRNEMWKMYATEIDQMRPVAIKFDKWFRYRWFHDQAFFYHYHWVTGIGYEIKNGERFLIVLDNGGYNAKTKRTRESKQRIISFKSNFPILSMVSFEPFDKQKEN
ncbi:C39 family peptidase [Jeotgalibacillus soli]|uniref:Peptidase C39-like domain-containing protein n=1 Tax=Jeotgalibacillus soli TaxID=889306 RepID=A0A0C2VMU9_9BACL|nr:C39 family peptidase [Jeotgalibacillus soli]KIL45333.1 hypothetical protein KP78_28770 [Jeotgalibacillus soli]